jgi:hypothetical protein
MTDFSLSVCAIFCNDEEECVKMGRVFMKDYHFTTDSYRMFAAVTRACHSPISWYSSGPNQKFILRQIKAMDSAIKKDGFHTGHDENEKPFIATELDIALLMIYGHILSMGTSYAYALSKLPSILRIFCFANNPRLLLPGLRNGSGKPYNKHKYRPCLYPSRS